MQNLTKLFEDEEFLEKVEEFTKRYFIKQNRNLKQIYDDSGEIKTENFKGKEYWKELKEVFWENQYYRCALCEKEITSRYSEDIEHYRPKIPYWWLAYNYKNYYLACADCNRKYKGVKFPLFDESKKVDYLNRKNIHQEQPLLINPTIDNPIDFFDLVFLISPYSGKGIVTLRPYKDLNKDSVKFKKAQKTIDILNLDLKEYDRMLHKTSEDFYSHLKELAEKRNKGWKEFSEYWKKFQKEDKFGISKLGLVDLILRDQFEI